MGNQALRRGSKCVPQGWGIHRDASGPGVVAFPWGLTQGVPVPHHAEGRWEQREVLTEHR